MAEERKHEPFIFLSTSVAQAGMDMIEGIGALTGLRHAENTEHLQRLFLRDLRKDIAKAMAALDDYEACLALGIEKTTREEFGKVRMPTRGGPTEEFPDAPYCKPDQSCCDFACGN